MRNRIACALVVAGIAMGGITLFGAGSALATGFSIYEAGSRATALGGAFTATADDGSAMFYNAAGLSFIPGKTVNVNAVFIRPDFNFGGQLSQGGPYETGSSVSQTFPVPGLYYTHNDGGKTSFGVGVYAPFGLGVEWADPTAWVGRRISHDVSIETVYVTPAISYRASPELALSVGLDVAHQKLNLKKYSPEPTFGKNAIHTELDGSSAWDVTPSLGLMYRPNEKTSFGVMYHFKKTMQFTDQDATLTALADGGSWAQALIAGLGGSAQTVSTDVNLPSILSLGLSYQLAPALRAEFNYVRFGWSAFDKLTLDFTNDALDQEIHFGYEDSYQLRFGTEYTASDKLSLMAGYVKDNTPQPLASMSPLLPDSDRNDYSFGVLYKAATYDVGASYMAVVGQDRTNIVNGEPARSTTDYPFGTYKAVANIFGVNFTYHF